MSSVASADEGGANVNSIFGDSQPPDNNPQVIPASNHASPFWGGRSGGSRGRGGGRALKRGGKGEGNASTTAPTGAIPNINTALVIDPEEDTRPAFTGISLRELEFFKRRNADGAESSVASEAHSKAARRDRRKRRREDERDGDGDDDAQLMNAAAFGGRPAAKRAVSKEGEEEEGEEDEDDVGEESEIESSVGGGCPNFPIRGETCVGCCFDRQVVGKIDDFVRTYCVSMTETALYRAAAMQWRNEVVVPRRLEGVGTPTWHWKDLRSHYELHAVDPLMQRAASVRTLGAMRSFHEESLLKINPDGSKSLDPKAAELMLKLIALSDKQISALDTARMPPPVPKR